MTAPVQVGVFPIRNHYYEPLFDARALSKSFSRERDLPGIDWNVDEQLPVLEKFRFHHFWESRPPRGGSQAWLVGGLASFSCEQERRFAQDVFSNVPHPFVRENMVETSRGRAIDTCRD
jgi:hypothetical protein